MNGTQKTLLLLVLVAGLSLTGRSLILGRPLEAFNWLAVFLSVGLSVWLGVWFWENDHYLIATLVAIASVTGFLAAINYSNAFDFRRQAVQNELMQFFLYGMGGFYGPVTAEANDIMDRGLRLCGMQKYIDFSDLATELQKSQYLGPTSSLVLGFYEMASGSPPKRVSCIANFHALARAAPDIAKIFARKHPDVLKYLD